MTIVLFAVVFGVIMLVQAGVVGLLFGGMLGGMTP